MEPSLRRYTELPFVIDLLTTRSLALLSPTTWDDRNDSYYIEQYGKRASTPYSYALCMARAPETYHHWRVFSHGSGGACIEFEPRAFSNIEGCDHEVSAQPVKYRTINDLRKKRPATKDLPFLKRYAFRDEREFRLFTASTEDHGPVFSVPVNLDQIARITLSPWMPKPVAENVKNLLKAIPGCENIKIFRSTLVENDDWKGLAGDGA